MGEREIIDKKIAELQASKSAEAASRRAAREAAERQAQEQRERTANLRSLAARFATWAAANRIPYDVGRPQTRSYDARSLGERLLFKPKRIVSQTVNSAQPGWYMAIRTETRVTGYGNYDGEATTVAEQKRLVVGADGQIQFREYSLSDAPPHRQDEEIAKFSMDDAYSRIAELAFQHKVEWSEDSA